jgi:aspartate/methionine/tyrosine aminotransferase
MPRAILSSGLTPQIAKLLNHATDVKLAVREFCANPENIEKTGNPSRVDPRVLSKFSKELFNYYFRDDLYGVRRSSINIALSKGSADETFFAMPTALKWTIEYALSMNWYGYSDSIGRDASREIIALYEQERVEDTTYVKEQVAITQGGTSAIASLFDFLSLSYYSQPARGICVLPNYPPLVEAAARRCVVSMVSLEIDGPSASLLPLTLELSHGEKVDWVFLQTVINPTGSSVDNLELSRLIEAHPDVLFILDECHECFGPKAVKPKHFSNSNVVRVTSCSKILSIPGIKTGWMIANLEFISRFYEYASTTYGSPPSIFYFLSYFYAAAQLAQTSVLERPCDVFLRAMQKHYDIPMQVLRTSFARFVNHSNETQDRVRSYRRFAYDQLVSAGLQTIEPMYSVNLVVKLSNNENSYRTYQRLADTCGVAVYPTCLSMCFDSAFCRITPLIEFGALKEGLDRICQASLAN